MNRSSSSGKSVLVYFFVTATMVEAVVPTAHPWVELPIQHPPLCLALSGRENHFVVSGEIVMFRVPVATTIVHEGNNFTLHAPVGRILRIEILEGQEPRALVNLFFYPAGLPTFPLKVIFPPTNRIYLQYPTEVVWSNYVQWIHQDQLISEAFVFLQSDYSTGPAGFSLGMENSFIVRAFWKRAQLDGEDAWTELAKFQSFPSNDSYSKRAWELVLKISRLIFYELSRSSITQASRRSDDLDFQPGEWEYLRYRLAPPVEVVEKQGVSTVFYSRKNGTKEVIKCRLTKHLIRVDTIVLFKRLQGVLGNSILSGLRMPTPAAPKLSSQDTFAFAPIWATNNDSFNLFHPLPVVSQDVATHRPIHRGIDFSYDRIKSKLRVAIRFRRAYPGDPSLILHLNFDIPPPDPPSDPDDDASDASSSTDDSATAVEEEEEEIFITAGQTLGSRTVVFSVIRVVAGGSHVICKVRESLDDDYMEGSEKVLTMVAAKKLYAQYHNDV
jgi:hypothetical protein